MESGVTQVTNYVGSSPWLLLVVNLGRRFTHGRKYDTFGKAVLLLAVRFFSPSGGEVSVCLEWGLG